MSKEWIEQQVFLRSTTVYNDAPINRGTVLDETENEANLLCSTMHEEQ
ncbi:hypothetical protein [Spirosoma koreense]